MKKKTIIIFIILLCIIFGVVRIKIFLEDFRFKTEDEIIAIFNSNKDEFYSAEEMLSEFDFSWSFRKIKNGTNEEYTDYWKYERMKDKIQITIQQEEHFDKMPSLKKTAESNDTIKNLLYDLKFKAIDTVVLNRGLIYFIKQSTIGFDSGILYMPVEKLPEFSYITKLVEIEPNWFYYERK